MMCVLFFFFFKQKTAYEMRISDWSSDVCSSDLTITRPAGVGLVLTLTAKSALAPAARDAAVQVNVAERGLPLYCLHCQPAGACTDSSAERRVGQECVSTCRLRGLTHP